MTLRIDKPPKPVRIWTVISEERKELAARHPRQRWLTRPLVFALPVPLIEALPSSGKTFWTDEEVAAELDLSALADQWNSIGFYDGYAIQQQDVKPPQNTAISRELFESLGWDNISLSDLNVLLTGGTALKDVHKQLRGYLGFLLTSRAFKVERSRLFRHRIAVVRASGESPRGPLAYGRPVDPPDPVYEQFLARWMLSSCNHWQAPLPQGPVGADWPRAQDGMYRHLIVPATMNVSERSLLATSLTVASASENPELERWRSIIKPASKYPGVPTLSEYQLMPYLHYWLQLGLRRRYAARMKGALLQADRWIANALGVSNKAIEAARHAMYLAP